MSAEFLFDQVNEILNLIRLAGGQTTSIIWDGNRTNQKLFKMFQTVNGKPWLTVDGIFLLFDFVHLLKNMCVWEGSMACSI